MKHALLTLLLTAAWTQAAPTDAEMKLRTLRAALSFGDTKAKLGAIGEIAKLGRNGEGAAPLLIRALTDSDRSVRGAAVGALGAIAPSTKQVVTPLTKLLGGEDDALAAAAVNVLGRTGPGAEPAVEALLKYAEGKSSTKIKSVIYALARIGPGADRAVPMILRAFNSKDRNLRESAAFALGNIGQPTETVVPALIGALGDSDNVVRERGARGLGTIGPKAANAESALRKALKDTDRTVASRAAWALGRLGASNEQTVNAMIELLQSSESNTLAAGALGRMGKPGIDALVKMLARPDSVSRLLAVRALGQIGQEASGATGAVRKATSDKDANVRQAAALAIEKIVGVPSKWVNTMNVSGKHALVCKSQWHDMDQSWAVKDKLNISGVEALAMIDPKKTAKPYRLHDELANSLAGRLLAVMQFTGAQKTELARWFGTDRRDVNHSVTADIKTTSRDINRTDSSSMTEISFDGSISTSATHRMASRFGPNSHQATSSIKIGGSLTVDRASGRIVKASVTVSSQTTGRYFNSSASGEPYTESFKLTIAPAEKPRTK